MMKNKLTSVTLVNSGDYGFSTIDIDGNVLLSGANGAGKSTFLRAVLFFYNPSLKRSDFGIDKKKSSFLDYYFPYPESYLLYEYINQYGKNYALVYKTKKLRFRFFSIDNRTEVNLKDIFYLDGETLEPDSVAINFRKIAVSESEVFVGVEQFQKIIYGQEEQSRQNKNDVKKYALYQANTEYKHIGNTIKNVFLNHKIDADSIKALLVSNIDEMDRPSVQLEIVKEGIDKFLDKQESIEQFSKHINIAESIAKSRNRYIELDGKQDKYLFNMIDREYFLVEEKGDLSTKIEELKEKFSKEDDKFTLFKKDFSEKLQKLRIKEGGLDDKIKEATEFLRLYHENNIEEKLVKYKTIESLKIEVASIEKEKDILIGKAENRVKAFDNEILMQEQKKNEIETDAKAEKLLHQQVYFDEKEKLRGVRDKELEVKSEEYDKNEERIVLKRDDLKELWQDKKEKLVKVQHTKVYENEIVKEREKLDSLKLKKTEFLSKSDFLGEEIDNLATQIEAKNEGIKHKIHSIELKHNIEIDKIAKTIETLNSKIDFQPNSLIGFLDTHNVAHKNKIFSTVKDELLVATNLNPKVVNDSSSIYGIEIDIALDETIEKLKEQLKQLKDDKGQLLKEKESLILLVEEESKKEINKLEKLRGEKYSEKSKIEKQLPLLEGEMGVQKEQLKSLEEKAKVEKERQEEEVQNDIKTLKEKIEACQKELEENNRKKKLLRKEISKKYAFLEKEELFNKEAKDKVSKKKREQLTLVCEEAIKSIKKRKEEVLKSEGISQEVLERLETKVKELRDSIKTYKGYEEKINEYKFNQKPKIDKLDSWKQELIDLRAVISNENSDYLDKKTLIEKLLKSIVTEQTTFQKKYDSHNLELKDFQKLKDLDSDFFNRIEILKNKQRTPSDDTYLTVTINDYYIHLSSLLKEINECKNDLIEEIGKLFKRIDSPELLNLIPNSDNSIKEFLRVGSDIERFLEEKKIEELIRETISLFNRATRQLTRDIEDIQKHTGIINTQLNKIRRGMNDLGNITVIDEIDIRLEGSENRILLNLEKLKEIHDEYGMDYDENSGEGLFAIFNQSPVNSKRTDREKKADREMMRLFKSLSQSIEEHKKDSLSLEECFEIQFKVSENNNEAKWENSLNGIGSEGTDVIVKILIYVSLLSLTKKESIKNEVDIHCLVDEIGKLSPLYFKEVIDFTNALGIYFVNGMPSEMLISSFKNHYKLRKIGKKKEKITVATKIIYRRDIKEL